MPGHQLHMITFTTFIFYYLHTYFVISVHLRALATAAKSMYVSSTISATAVLNYFRIVCGW